LLREEKVMLNSNPGEYCPFGTLHLEDGPGRLKAMVNEELCSRQRPRFGLIHEHVGRGLSIVSIQVRRKIIRKLINEEEPVSSMG
jgi:hypothetical protein